MPSKSKKQHRLMEAAAHNPAFAKKVGVPMSVAKDFIASDKGKYDGLPQQAKKEGMQRKLELLRMTRASGKKHPQPRRKP